ncbi:ATP-binding protein [Chitinophagaceae bacterium LWZ2-11]
MITPSIPYNEQERIQELYRLEILDTPVEEDFDEIVQLASKICNMPISLITLVDTGRQWFKAKIGIDIEETSRDVSFCGHVLSQKNNDLMEIEDAQKDNRFFDNPFVLSDPGVRFYAGMPLITVNGYKLGTLCVLDNKPNRLTPDQTFTLKVLANQVVKMLEMRVINKEVVGQNKLIEQQNFTQQQMLSIIAHDIKSPLSAVKQAMDVDELGLLSIEQRQAIRKEFVQQIDDTLHLLSDLVEWGTIQVAGKITEVEKIDLKKLVDSKLKIYMLSASRKGNKLLNKVDEGIFLSVYPQTLRFILRNLLVNAIKFTTSGVITVYGKKETDFIHISVCDTGVGMSEESKDSIVKEKVVKSSTGTNNEKGSGLGLILTQQFIRALSGSLQIESVPGKGTTVHVFLPAVE